jgi:hypothetical protein
MGALQGARSRPATACGASARSDERSAGGAFERAAGGAFERAAGGAFERAAGGAFERAAGLRSAAGAQR